MSCARIQLGLERLRPAQLRPREVRFGHVCAARIELGDRAPKDYDRRGSGPPRQRRRRARAPGGSGGASLRANPSSEMRAPEPSSRPRWARASGRDRIRRRRARPGSCVRFGDAAIELGVVARRLALAGAHGRDERRVGEHNLRRGQRQSKSRGERVPRGRRNRTRLRSIRRGDPSVLRRRAIHPGHAAPQEHERLRLPVESQRVESPSALMQIGGAGGGGDGPNEASDAQAGKSALEDGRGRVKISRCTVVAPKVRHLHILGRRVEVGEVEVSWHPGPALSLHAASYVPTLSARDFQLRRMGAKPAGGGRCVTSTIGRATSWMFGMGVPEGRRGGGGSTRPRPTGSPASPFRRSYARRRDPSR